MHRPSRLLAVLLLPAVLAATRAWAGPGQATGGMAGTTAPVGAIWLDSLGVSNIVQGWGDPHADASVEGNPLSLNGAVYPHGIGTHAESRMAIRLRGSATSFGATVGVDDEKKGLGSVVFQVWVDGRKVAESGVMRGGMPPVPMTVSLMGARSMELVVTDAGDGIDSDHADWAGAWIALTPGSKTMPKTVPVPGAGPAPVEPARMRVVPDGAVPKIHGARVVGTTPGRPFEFLIAATGQQPLRYAAAGLPDGITLDPHTGILSGSASAAGETTVHLTVTGPAGTARRDLVIRAGDHMLAQTPPLGWNSWNVWASNVNDQHVREAVDGMISSGLASHGFQYVNIDDCWEAGRDPDGNIQPNSKFPDMRALADYAHSRGLKLGIYSSPGPRTCGGYEASYQHEQQDANSYADWGIDYLKYDWCSYGGIAKDSSLPELQKPYAVMRTALDNCKRDILFSFCQYGMGDVWKWGAQIGGNCWRTTGDITDTWQSLHDILESQNGHEVYAGPGHWNDPDMLIVGRLGWGNPHPTRLTPNEQLIHISMWCMLSAPLLIGCDMAHLDPFTVAILSNDEMIDISQDPLGKPAARRFQRDGGEAWSRPLFDGSTAVALVNTADRAQTVTATWQDLGLAGAYRSRDLWMHRGAGTMNGKCSALVPAHGIVVYRLWPRRAGGR